MRKIIAAINMTLDGFCDHTAVMADEEIHQHYTTLLGNSGTLLYGRITYQMMESYWPSIVKNPTGIKSSDEFALAIDRIPKIVFSNKKNADSVVNSWKTAALARREIKEEVLALQQEAGKDIVVGSRSLIITLLNLNLIDEFQLCIHPVIAGGGESPLLQNIHSRIMLKLIKTKTFGCGAVIHYYAPVKK